MIQMKNPLAVLVHPDDISRLRENITRLKRLQDGEINEFSCRVKRRDGEWRWVSARSMPFIRNAEGELRQIVNATFDVTEQKRAEVALRAAHDELKRLVAERTHQL